MNTNFLDGTGVAIVTPFRKDDSVDFRALEKHVNYLINNGIDYIVALGTTSETATLMPDERKAVVDYILDTVNERIPVVVGIGGNNTQHVISTIKSYNFDRISAVLSVAPYYNKPTQKGLYFHYRDIAGSCPLPLILYNVPGRTSVNIDAETTLQLAHDVDNIIAVKEASGNLEQVSVILRDKPENFRVISGDDMLTLPIIALGGSGVISVSANAFPQQFSDMVRHALAGDFAQARKIHLGLVPIMQALFAEGNPGGVKVALKLKEIMLNHLRLPLARVSKSHYQKIAKLLDEYEK